MNQIFRSVSLWHRLSKMSPYLNVELQRTFNTMSIPINGHIIFTRSSNELVNAIPPLNPQQQEFPLQQICEAILLKLVQLFRKYWHFDLSCLHSRAFSSNEWDFFPSFWIDLCVCVCERFVDAVSKPNRSRFLVNAHTTIWNVTLTAVSFSMEYYGVEATWSHRLRRSQHIQTIKTRTEKRVEIEWNRNFSAISLLICLQISSVLCVCWVFIASSRFFHRNTTESVTSFNVQVNKHITK